MGMAASQARFLGLTARKTNVEYEGQQINQQRTTLSNQTANYYNQLLGMQVPTPPSVADYTKTVYTFQDGNLSNSITSLIAKENGLYTASYVSSWTNDFTPVAAGTAIVNRAAIAVTDKTDDVITVTDKTDDVITVTDADDNETHTAIKAQDNNYYTVSSGATEYRALGTGIGTTDGSYTGDDEYLNSLSDEQRLKLVTEEQEYIALLNKKYNGGNNATWLVKYVQNSSTGTWSPQFVKADTLANAIYDDETGISQSNIPTYTMGSAAEVEEVKGKTARLEKDSTGRYTSITFYEDNNGTQNPVTYTLTTNTLTDQDAYDDAMNQYEYDKYQYDQAIQEINAKIEIIQAQDKNLELRLKQLDTEQDAIQTEMEAVQKVIEKNTESTFKTFG